MRLTNPARAALPHAYIYTTGIRTATGGQADPLGTFAARARTEPNWAYRELATGHAPYVTAPEALVNVLLERVTEAGLTALGPR